MKYQDGLPVRRVAVVLGIWFALVVAPPNERELLLERDQDLETSGITEGFFWRMKSLLKRQAQSKLEPLLPT